MSCRRTCWRPHKPTFLRALQSRGRNIVERAVGWFKHARAW
ncbi:MAG TPA: hypothetical protein VFG66_04950 [Gemmatimonadales bacterium]|nr:hypothetical protein [Gemmatimonadales bacterium]